MSRYRSSPSTLRIFWNMHNGPGRTDGSASKSSNIDILAQPLSSDYEWLRCTLSKGIGVAPASTTCENKSCDHIVNWLL